MSGAASKLYTGDDVVLSKASPGSPEKMSKYGTCGMGRESGGSQGETRERPGRVGEARERGVSWTRWAGRSSCYGNTARGSQCL